MLVALLRFDRQELLAGMLLFRLLYYIAPFVLSLLILGGRELILTVSARSVAKSKPAKPDWRVLQHRRDCRRPREAVMRIALDPLFRGPQRNS